MWPKYYTLLASGIASMTQKTPTWLVDGGTDEGVMKLMGEIKSRTNHDAPLIGFAPMSQLHHSPREGEGQHINVRGDQGGGVTALNPNHTHYVLVDGAEGKGKSEMFDRAAEFRGAFCEYVTSNPPHTHWGYLDVTVVEGECMGPGCRYSFCRCKERAVKIQVGSSGQSKKIQVGESGEDSSCEQPVTLLVYKDRLTHAVITYAYIIAGKHGEVRYPKEGGLGCR
jgi:hypothetical protein